ncbi:hypothetical protein [Legionella rowbothamii]|uniref:hypothetical protein n=1 Tax=Legionella rowbothamii TaxID=96229 RepID=UPI001054FCB6|nr:hypothetical protein [Legionella rowbothamii]
MAASKDNKDGYWFSTAWFFTRLPTIAVWGFLLPNYSKLNDVKHWSESELAPNNIVLKVPFYAAASALMLLSFPIDLIVGLIVLPMASLHDLFVFSGLGQSSEQEETMTSKLTF